MTEFQKIVINLVNEGNTVTNIAKMLGRNVSSVSSVVKRFNLNPVKAFKNTVDNNFFLIKLILNRKHIYWDFYCRWMY